MDFILEFSKAFISGSAITILISLLAAVNGFIIGIIICLAKISKNKILRIIANIYIEIIRDTPLLVQLMLIVYALPTIGINFPPFFSLGTEFTGGLFALSINSGAYIAEIMRSGINAVDKGQVEASRSLGFNYSQTMRYIIIPQAIKNILPALANEFITLVKESAIISVVGISDLMFVAGTIRNSTFDALRPFLFAALIYFIITFTLSKLVGILEVKMAKGER